LKESGGCQGFQAGREPRLVARRGVVLDDAPLDGAVNDGIRAGQSGGGRLHIFGGQQAPEGADLFAQSRLASRVEDGSAFNLPGPFKRGYGVRHLADIHSLEWILKCRIPYRAPAGQTAEGRKSIAAGGGGGDAAGAEQDEGRHLRFPLQVH